MNQEAFKGALRAAIVDAIERVGINTFKDTSMLPLSRRKAASELKRAA